MHTHSKSSISSSMFLINIIYFISIIIIIVLFSKFYLYHIFVIKQSQ